MTKKEFLEGIGMGSCVSLVKDPDAEAIRIVPGFPKEGVNFLDVASLFSDATMFSALIRKMISQVSQCDKIVAVDARGFVFAGALSVLCHKPVILARKKGKLPPPVLEQSYALEYGEATICIEEDSVCTGDKVCIIDDILATGGTLNAVANMCMKQGASVSACVLADLKFLHGDLKFPYSAVVTYSAEP